MANATWRAHGIGYEHAGRYGIKFTSDGTLTLLAPPACSACVLTDMHVKSSGSTIVVGPTSDAFCTKPASYTWKVSGSTLILTGGTKDKSPSGCLPRVVLFTTGAWKRQ
jgi:hypothetical protein